MKKKKGRVVIFLLVIILCAAACSPAAQDGGPGLPNPAAVNCEESRGRSEIRSAADGNQYGVCIFDDGSECEEWAFMRGECAPGTFTISWQSAVDLVNGGFVDALFQTHDLSVELELKDGRSLMTVEPQIDAIMQIVDECGDVCGDIIVATE